MIPGRDVLQQYHKELEEKFSDGSAIEISDLVCRANQILLNKNINIFTFICLSGCIKLIRPSN